MYVVLVTSILGKLPVVRACYTGTSELLHHYYIITTSLLHHYYIITTKGLQITTKGLLITFCANSTPVTMSLFPLLQSLITAKANYYTLLPLLPLFIPITWRWKWRKNSLQSEPRGDPASESAAEQPIHSNPPPSPRGSNNIKSSTGNQNGKIKILGK